jgi:hypothetical protein
MNQEELIRELERSVRETEELLERTKQALAALKGNSARGTMRGLRTGSLPDRAFAVLKSTGSPMTVQELTDRLQEQTGLIVLNRDLSLALNRYVRLGRYFCKTDDHKYCLRTDVV